jgi:syndecan 4
MCRCPFGFRGEYCEDSKVCTDPWCQLCRNGSCACPSNATWCRPSSGRKQLQCHPSCLNGGFCHEGKCRCPYGFKGDHCQIPPGQRCGEGHCYHTTACNKTSGTCVCPPQLTGPYCNISTCYPMCQNNGTCIKTGDSPYCTCKPGFGGRHCEHNLTECGHSYCYNGGECVSGRCVCRPEYTGLHCKIPQCNATCQNGGTCQFSHCQCPQGYGGLYCEQEYTYCRGLMCGNNGYCIRDRCVCLPGFTGPTCETEMCSRVCPYYGRCLHQKCYCPNYTSSEDACDQYYTKCGDTPCLNNGTCDGSSCVCARGYTGVYCEVEICNIDCLNGATCHRDSCVCAKGWKGDRCQIRAGIATRPKQKDKTLFRVQYCPVEVETGEKGTFEWPQTQARGVARLPCPCAMNPSLTKGIFAWRKCSSRGVWRDADWTACSRSTRIQRLCSVDKQFVAD